MNIYQNIDEMPLYNWRKINETNDLKYMFRKSGMVTKGNFQKIADAFYKIRDEFFDKFKVPDNYKRILEINNQILIWEIRMILENDPSHKNFIKILQFEKERLTTGDQQKYNFHEVKGYVEKYMGFRIDEKTVSVAEYYSYIEIMNTNINKIKAA